MNARPVFITIATITTVIVALYSYVNRHGNAAQSNPTDAEVRFTRAAIYRQIGSLNNVPLQHPPKSISGVLSGVEFTTADIVIDPKYIEFKANGSWFYMVGIGPMNDGLSAQIFSADGYPADVWISSGSGADKTVVFTTERPNEIITISGK